MFKIDSKKINPDILTRILYFNDPIINVPQYLIDSFEAESIIQPLIVFKLSSDSFFLLDGVSRLKWARQKKMVDVPCTVIESDSIVKYFLLLLSLQSPKILKSPVTKSLFLKECIDQGLSRSWIQDHVAQRLQFNQHHDFLKTCLKVTQLPKPILGFAYDKDFSLKQCQKLTLFDFLLILKLFNLKETFHFSASLLIESAEILSDYISLKQVSLDDLFQNKQYLITTQKESISQRTQAFKLWLKHCQLPRLEGVNSDIKDDVKQMDLPSNVHVIWDKTLENKFAEIKIKITDDRQWTDLVDTLKQHKVVHGLKNMLKKI